MRKFLKVLALVLLGASPVSARIIDAKKTVSGESIGLAIMGAIVNTNKSESVALIKESSTGKVKAVKPGHDILEKYVVQEVAAKFLVIKDKTTKDQTLVYLDKFAGEFVPKSSQRSVSGLSSSLDSYREDGFERSNGKISMTAAYRDKVVNQDLSKILMDATALPNYENGQIKGFRLLQITPGSIYDNAGFKDDDIITSINGKPLSNVPATIKLLHSLKGETSVEIEILRGGSYQNMSVSVN